MIQKLQHLLAQTPFGSLSTKSTDGTGNTRRWPELKKTASQPSRFINEQRQRVHSKMYEYCGGKHYGIGTDYHPKSERMIP